MDDLDLLQRYVRFRDQDALAQLIEKYHGMVLATCRRRLYSQADAEDAAQDVLLAFTRDADKITSSVPGWLHICAVNTSVSMIRARRSQVCRDRQDRGLGDEPCAAGKAIRRETDAVLDDCLGQLDPTDRELLIQNHVMDVPQQAIAVSMGMTQQAVAKRIGRAMTRLRGKLVRRGVLTPTIAIIAMLSRRSARAWASLPSMAAKQLPTLGLVGKIKLGAVAAVALVAATVTYKCAMRPPQQAPTRQAAPSAWMTPTAGRAPVSDGARVASAGRLSTQARDVALPALTLAPVTHGALAAPASPGPQASDATSPIQQMARSDRPPGMNAFYDMPARDDPLADAAETQLHPTVEASSSATRSEPSREEQAQAQEQDEPAEADAPGDRPIRRIRKILDLQPQLAAVRAWRLWPLGEARELPAKDPSGSLRLYKDQLSDVLIASGTTPQGRFDLDAVFQISVELGDLISMCDQRRPIWTWPAPAQDITDAPITVPEIAVLAPQDTAGSPLGSSIFAQSPAAAAWGSLAPPATISVASVMHGPIGIPTWPVQTPGLSVGTGTETAFLHHSGLSAPKGYAAKGSSRDACATQTSPVQEIVASLPACDESPSGPPPMPVQIPEPATGLILIASAAAILRPRRHLAVSA